ncbi:MAG: NAD(+) synthase [Planctomycetes bacterium]|nr:NAD(+) synthase [Planctomycetota bacterium]
MTTTDPGTSALPPFSRAVLALDPADTATRLQTWLRTTIARDLQRRGACVATSGGVDSAVCLALAVHALGAPRVEALWLPGQNSSPVAAARARELCATFGVALHEQDIQAAQQALGGYRARDAAIRRVFPDWEPGQRYKIAIADGLLERDRANLFDLVVERADGALQRARLPLDSYLELVAATNMKQRLRMLLLHHAAERRNFAVVGTPNRVEHALGFFVRGGDAVADLEPIAHLYKAQVYALAEHLGVPASIRTAEPSTDTYSLPQTQTEFYFALPWQQLDLLLWAHEHAVPATAVAAELGLDPGSVDRAFADLARKRQHARRLHQAPRRAEVLS